MSQPRTTAQKQSDHADLLSELAQSFSAGEDHSSRYGGLAALTSKMMDTGGAAAGSPTLTTLQHLGSRWSPLIILVLATGTYRHGELQRVINTICARMNGARISQHILTMKLRELEREGFVKRDVWPMVPPRTDYALTELGASLAERINTVVDWSEANTTAISAARSSHSRTRPAYERDL